MKLLIFISIVLFYSCTPNKFSDSDFFDYKQKAQKPALLRTSVDSVNLDYFAKNYIKNNFGEFGESYVLNKFNIGINTMKKNIFQNKNSFIISDMPFSIKGNSKFSNHTQTYKPLDIENVFKLNDEFETYDYIICFGNLYIVEKIKSIAGTKKYNKPNFFSSTNSKELLSKHKGINKADGASVTGVSAYIHYSIIDIKTKMVLQNGIVNDTFYSRIDFKEFGKYVINQILDNFL